MFCMVVQKAQLGLFYQLQIIKKRKSLSNGLGIIFTFCLGLYVWVQSLKSPLESPFFKLLKAFEFKAYLFGVGTTFGIQVKL